MRKFITGLCLSPIASLFILAGVVLLSACSFIGKQADQRLGDACTPEVRLVRAAMFTDTMQKHFGQEVPHMVTQLKDKLELMADAVNARAGVDAAGDAYKLTFVKAVMALAVNRGKEITLGGMNEAVDWLRSVPERGVEIAADINTIEARVQIACAGLAKAKGV